MVYEITCTFRVAKLKDDAEAKEFGASLCEHVLDTFNDDGSISPLVTVKAKPKGRG
jgi:hypothetical protein